MDQRVRWLRANVVSPATKLLQALSDENGPMLSEWPEVMYAPPPDRDTLRLELQKLRNRADELVGVLEDRLRGGGSFQTEFRADLTNALTDVFERHFPQKKPSRDGYDKTSVAAGGGSSFANFIRLCTEEIFPGEKALSGYVVDDIAKMRGNR